ncbi:MAG TPA: AraC family transcriptional regulator [Streptosporangiaceae bacterium]
MGSGGADESSLRALRRARDLIDRDYAQDIPIAALAAEAGYSDGQFIRAFAAAYGETPGRYRSRRRVRALVAKGAMSPGVIATTDCRGDYEVLSARGVQFLQEPAERPYGIEALLRDDSGNWFSFTQRGGTTGA